jgi:hypothetical protein
VRDHIRVVCYFAVFTKNNLGFYRYAFFSNFCDQEAAVGMVIWGAPHEWQKRLSGRSAVRPLMHHLVIPCSCDEGRPAEVCVVVGLCACVIVGPRCVRVFVCVRVCVCVLNHSYVCVRLRLRLCFIVFLMSCTLAAPVRRENMHAKHIMVCF